MPVHRPPLIGPARGRTAPQEPAVRRRLIVTLAGRTVELGAGIVRSGEMWKNLFPPDPAYAALRPRASTPA